MRKLQEFTLINDHSHSRFRALLFAVCLVVMTTVSPSIGAERVALVVGNGAYKHGNPLKNPLADATDVADTLGRIGFELVGGRVQTDLGHEEMEGMLAKFKEESEDAKVVLFFFAGHGMEVGGTNYLVPVDAEVQEEFQVKHRTLPLDEVLAAIAGDDRLKIVILDCCRNNPLGRGWNRNGAAGLGTPASIPDGTVLLFSAAPGQVAADGVGRNSPFTHELKTALLSPGAEIEQVFKQVGAAVNKKTGKQRPWMNSSFYGSFSFVSEGENLAVPLRKEEVAEVTNISESEKTAGVSRSPFGAPEDYPSFEEYLRASREFAGIDEEEFQETAKERRARAKRLKERYEIDP